MISFSSKVNGREVQKLRAMRVQMLRWANLNKELDRKCHRLVAVMEHYHALILELGGELKSTLAEELSDIRKKEYELSLDEPREKQKRMMSSVMEYYLELYRELQRDFKTLRQQHDENLNQYLYYYDIYRIAKSDLEAPTRRGGRFLSERQKGKEALPVR